MPLVFVHGVATRQTAAYLQEVAQRNILFRRLVIDEEDKIFDPDWGSDAVQFARGGWVPTPGANEVFAFGAPAQTGASAAAVLAQRNLDAAIDLAFGALLATKAQVKALLSKEELEAFVAAVKYLDGSPDRTAFRADETDAEFAQSLMEELRQFLPVHGAPATEAMGLAGNVIGAIGEAIRAVTDPLRNAGSDAVLRLVREPLSNGVGLFLGDIFVYLRWRELDGANGTYNRIFQPIINDLAKANAARETGRKLIVVGHSLGGVILYDLLTNRKALEQIKTLSGKDLQVDFLVTVGSQPGLFADMGLYGQQAKPAYRLARPPCVTHWMNVYDFTDVFSFHAVPYFTGVEDFEFDNVSGALDAHTAYFQRPSFYKRLRARLAQ